VHTDADDIIWLSAFSINLLPPPHDVCEFLCRVGGN
jgi:hypothetical protein